MNHIKKMLLSAATLLLSFGGWAQNNPVANEAAIVQSGNMRFTVLSAEMIRIEYSE